LENRALLAFVLSLGVFVVWGYFLAWMEEPLPQERSEKDEAIQKTDLKKTPHGSDSSVVISDRSFSPVETSNSVMESTSPSQPLTFGGTLRSIRVENGPVTYVFSNRGAHLEHVYMNRFTENGEPIDLVAQEEGAKPPLTLVSNDDTVDNILRNAFYETSSDLVELSEESPDVTLRLTLKHESGLEVERKFTFHYGQYLIDVNTRIAAPGYPDRNLTYAVIWGPGLGGAVSSHTDHFVFSGPTTFLNGERVETQKEEIKKRVYHKGELTWTGFQNKYFAAAIVPVEGIAYGLVEENEDNSYVGLQFQTVQSAASPSYILYVGTKELVVLEEAGHKLSRLMDYGWVGNKFAFLVKPLLKTLQFFYNITGNYGWSIIFLTIIIKIFFFPLTHKSFKSMRGLQKIQPYVKVIQERNKDDRQKMNEEMIDLYRKHKVNPMGGCLPMLLQIPVFIALYHALFFSIELRGAPFIGWITDLSVADPYYVTPVLMGMTMFLQQKMTPSVGDPIQQKIMMFLPVIFTFLFVTFPAGLVIYWTINNLLTIAQQYYIYHVIKD
tara:strand:- start:2075 stop:3730 length:1656 start_codon:yes stop_codon:yes gene_type:complete